MRKYESGSTRNSTDNKLHYEGFLSPACLESYAKYMHLHSIQSDGNKRDPDNWQKGIPQDVYMDSDVRHLFDLWAIHRGGKRFSPEDGHELNVEELCNAILFNTFGYLFEELKKRRRCKMGMSHDRWLTHDLDDYYGGDEEPEEDEDEDEE